MRASLRESGIDIIGDVPWGTHFCQFYQTKEDLVEILVPYFKAGLENNEFCLWVTSQPLEVEEAKEAMKKAVPDIDVYLKKGQIKIIPYTHGCVKESLFDLDRTVNSWIEKIDQVLARGYDGLRATGDIRWLEKESCDDFVDYEKKVDSLVDKNPVLTLCPYYLDICSTAEIIDIVSNHQFALVKREGKWERIENSGRKKAEEVIQEAKSWKYTFDAIPDPVAIIDNECRIARINRAMAARLGTIPEECVGLICYRIIHGIDSPPPFCPHRQLLKDKSENTTEVYEDRACENFAVSIAPVHDSEKNICESAYVSHDINELKKEEHRIRKYNRILEGINRIFSNVVQAKTEEELGEVCLSVALEITGSQFGFINEMGADGLLHDIAKSELGWEQCFMYDKTGHRRPPSDYNVHGLYGSVIENEKSFFTNNPQSHPDSIGLPDGHPSITSFLGVPLVQEGETVGLIAVANRDGGYSCEQQVDLEAIAPAVTQALQRKKAEQKREQAERALQVSEERYRSLYENSLDGILLTKPDGTILCANHQACQMFGMTEDEIIQAGREGIVINDEKLAAALEERARTGRMRAELIHRRKDGSTFVCDTTSKLFLDAYGNLNTSLIIRDISERKRVEKELLESDEKFRSVLENSLDSAYRMDLQASYFDFMSPVIEKITGFSVKEIRAMSNNDLLDRIHPDDRPRIIAEIVQSLEEGFGTHEYRFKCKDGKYCWLADHFSIIKDKSGIVRFRSGIVRDITRRKKAEEVIRLSNTYNRSLIEASLDPLVTIGHDGKITDINKATELVTGYSKNELIGTDFSDYFTEPQEARKGYEQVFTDGKVRDYPLEIQHRDGHSTPVLYNASVYKDENGKVIGVFAAARDITERKKAEEAVRKAYDNLEKLVKERTAELEKAYASLKESEEGLAEAQRIAHIGDWDWDLVTGKMHWSEELYCIFGRNPEDLAPSGNEFLSYVHPDDRDYVEKSIKKGLKEEPKNGINYRIVLANGKERTVYSQAEVIFNEQKIPVRVKGIVQDITERKKTEEKILTLANAVESSSDAILTFSLEGTILSWNKGAEQIYGYSAEEIIGKNISITEPDDLKGEIKLFSQKLKQGEKSQHYETVRLKKDGKKVNISAIISPVFKESGEFVAILAIGRDITERKREEKALRESEARLRRFYESDMFGVIYYSIDGSITDANDKFLEIVGYSREDLRAGRINWRNITPPEYRLLDEQAVEELKATGRNVVHEKEYIRKDGSHVSIILGAASFDREGQEGVAFVIDNMERKKAEEALAEIDRIRIKEIHHRIKNNLQVISSLLDLQAEKFQNKQVLEAFRESQNRVISMALIHEELYKGEGTDNLDFSAYLQELAENLFKTYCLKSKNIHLLMDLEENAFFDMDTAVPLGIIVNELVSNSLKHAFPEKEGEIRIKLSRKENNSEIGKSLFSLTISDNGKGIPENIELESLESLGLQLVNTLVDQLDGELELKREQGTEFRITFSVAERS